MMPPPAPAILPDVKSLIESSQCRPMLKVFRPGTGLAFLIAAAIVGVLPIQTDLKIGLEVGIWLSFLATFAYFWHTVRSLKAEVLKLNEVEDSITLKRHTQAAASLQWLMTSPMRGQQNRLRAIFLLGATLSRLRRFEDALIPFNELINSERIAGPAGVAVKLGRAMAMIHSEHLYDADRAINELRRLIDRGGADDEVRAIDASHPQTPSETPVIAAFRLVELYRDVKTGHSQEAIDLFEKNRALMSAGLGHRVGEAYALAAVAYDRIGNTIAAQQSFSNGTALQAVTDILNLYSEVRALLGKYTATIPPALA